MFFEKYCIKNFGGNDGIRIYSLYRNRIRRERSEEVESYGMKVIDNPEWIYAITDASDHLLFGIHSSDGSIEWGAGIPTLIKNKISELTQRVEKLENNATYNTTNQVYLRGHRATEGASPEG